MPRLLLDTDVLVDHLRKGERLPAVVDDAAYSTITRAELYGGRNTDERVVDLLLSAFEEVPVDRRIAEETGRIRRRVGLALGDAVIAATALLTGRALLTRNLRHFESVSGLRLYRS